MADFSQDIRNFQKYGTYTYKFDDTGNLIFNSSSADFSQAYVSFPLFNIIYDNIKIASFYKLDFEEFIPTPTTITFATEIKNIATELTSLQQENEALKTQLDTLTNQPNSSNIADQQATKQVILELRKTVGQGRVDSDFSDTFPYTAIRKST
jgi:hypothetical protein